MTNARSHTGVTAQSTRHNIAAHGRQPRPRGGYESHHSESKTNLQRNVPNYDPNKDPTILLEKQTHRGVVNPMQRQHMARPGSQKQLGTIRGLEPSIAELRAAGVPEEKIGQLLMEHTGYQFETTPLSQVRSVLGR
jgi:hypothetical protein